MSVTKQSSVFNEHWADTLRRSFSKLVFGESDVEMRTDSSEQHCLRGFVQGSRSGASVAGFASKNWRIRSAVKCSIHLWRSYQRKASQRPRER